MGAEAKLLIATYNDIISNVDTDINMQHYKEAVDMFRECEKSLVSFAQYYDKVFQTLPDDDRDGKGGDMQIHMINLFGKSLQYGTTYVYQSMPRLLSIWFDFGTRLLDVNSNALKEERKNTLLKMTKLIDTFLERLPTFIFLTCFSQLVSRICHPQKEVYIELKSIIVKLILQYPQQTMWMMISVIKSSYAVRTRRCAEILSDSRLKTPSMVKLVGDFTNLAEKLIELCNKNINDNVTTASVSALLKSLPRLLSKSDFSEIMIPTQKFRKLVLPNPDFRSSQHNPFPNHYIHIIGIQDEIVILPSLQRPRKITFKGSDGKDYIQMLKPKDDLRKDFRLMEFNDIVNQLLSWEAESRQRRLNIRLYSVAPLNEECGLIEWVPNLVGLRPVLMNLYKQRGLGMKGRELKDSCCNIRDPLIKKRETFTKKLLPKHPPILGEWFKKTFPDAQGWLTARTAYIRTTAVISMVGYILGLGDRHGENILLDSTCGDTIHVDFNCLFNKGESFEWPERVPFRLTHNMVGAMGPLGTEGIFRISCACTLRVLRTYTTTLMSIVRPFVYDPLVSWPRNAPGSINALTAERTNEQAVEHIRNIELRLQGMIKRRARSFSIPLSVEGQTNNLINEAVSIDNLCQMYIGWGPYL